MNPMKRVYLGVGSNLGLREDHFRKARILLSYRPGIQFIQSSPIYETEPEGGPPQGKFLNAVWEIATDVSPQELLMALLEVEKALGRQRGEKNEPRTIDLDILFYDDLVLNELDLIIPHPRIPERWFVLRPLCDLTSELVHPVLGKRIAELLDGCHAGC